MRYPGRKKLVLVLMGLFTVAMLHNGCYYDNEEELYPFEGLNCVTTGVAYAADVTAILSANCYECHNTANATNLGSGIVLEGYTAVKTYIDNGRLLCAIKHELGCSQMPKGRAQLADCDISKIEAWANSGAANN